MGSTTTGVAELYGGDCKVTHSVYVHLEDGYKNNPNGDAVIVMSQRPDHLAQLVDSAPGDKAMCLTWTYNQLHEAALKVACGLLAHGVRSGDTVATFMSNRLEYPIMLWTCAMLKLTLASLDPGALTVARSAELQNLTETLKPDVIVAYSIEGGKVFDDVLLSEGMKQPLVRIRLDYEHAAPQATKWLTLPDLAESGRKHPVDPQSLLQDAREDDPNRWALILFTSGTSSGRPKGCPRHVAAVSHNCDIHFWDMRSRPGATARFLLPTPNFRVIAPTLSLATWKEGGTVVMPPPPLPTGFNAAGILDAIEQHRVTILLLIPAAFHSLIGDPSFQSRKLDSLNTVRVGADIITKDLYVSICQTFPHCRTDVAHGMTETGGLLQWPPTFFKVPTDDLPYFGEICPLGEPAPGCRVRIWDHESKSILIRDKPGELILCCESIIKHYLGNIGADMFFHDDEGRLWFRTGDLGIISGQGVVYILGRIKDIIKRSGLSITPAALETTITKFLGSETCVISMPHPVYGQEPFAVIRDFNAHSEDDIKEHVLSMFGKDYALGGVTSLKQLGLDDFPLNAMAKVKKFDLQSLVSEYLKQ